MDEVQNVMRNLSIENIQVNQNAVEEGQQQNMPLNMNQEQLARQEQQGGDESVLPELEYVQVNDRIQMVRDAVEGRTISKILTDAIDKDSDSQEMQEVKKKISACNRLLNKKLSEADTKEDIRKKIDNLELGYMEAIGACQYYCDHKNPHFKIGEMRKQAVEGTLDMLKNEYRLLSTLRNMSPEEMFRYDDNVKLIDLVTEAGFIKKDEQAAEEQSAKEKAREKVAADKQKDPIGDLTYKDFMKMLSTDDDDHLEFRGQSLRIVKNGIFSKPADVATESNKKMVERFITVAMEKIEQKQDLSEEQKTNMKMRLQYQLNVKLTDTQTAAVPISKLREAMEMVNHISSDVEIALSREKLASPLEHRLAMAVDESLAIPEQKEVKSKAVHKKIQGILEEARKAGIIIPSISDGELQNIVENKLHAIRDDAFNNMKRIYESMSCLKGGKAADFSSLASDKKAVNYLMAMSIARMTSMTSAGAEAADYQMRTYMTHLAFEHTQNLSLKKDFMKIRINSLTGDGGSELDELVLRPVSKSKELRKDSAKIQRGMHKLKEVCQKMEELSDLQSKAFCKGLTEDEAARIQQIGVSIDTIIDNQDSFSDMEFVVKQLQGTRFAEGFGRLQTLKKEGNEVFDKATKKIANATKIKERRQDIFEKSPLAIAKEKTMEQLDIKDESTHFKLNEVDEIISGLHGSQKDIASILMLKKKPTDLIKDSGDDNAKSIAQLYYGLRSMSYGDAWADVVVLGEKMTMRQRDNGDVEIKFDNQRIVLPFTVGFMMSQIEQDVSANLEKYGEELSKEVLQNTFIKNQQEQIKLGNNRAIYSNILKQKAEVDSQDLINLPVEVVSDIAEQILKGELTKEVVQQQIKVFKQACTLELNEKDTLEMIKVMEEQERLNKNAKPTVIISKNEKKEEEKGPQWTPEEAELIELISDVIFSKDTWKDDLEQRSSGDRMRMVMYQHTELLAKILFNPKLIDDTFNKLKIDGVDEVANMIKEQFEQLTNNPAMSKLKILKPEKRLLLFKAVLGDEQDMKNAEGVISEIENAQKMAKKVSSFGSKFGGFFGFKKEEKKEEEPKEEEEETSIKDMLLEQKKSMINKFRQMDRRIEEQAEAQVDKIQDKINETVGTLFDDKGVQASASLENLTLKQIIEKNIKGQEGQGKFFKLVLTKYFKEADIMDKRAMIASALRDVKPSPVEDGRELTQKEKEQQMGTFLGGFLKGAGPLLHKTLQGLSTDGMPESLKTAIGDMKSKLSPISEEIVKARMNKMIMNSKGMITRIEVKRSLGAASIGQVFMCKIYGPNMEAEGRDVVIKLLRPDVQNHLEREKEFMLRCAKETSAGMVRTFMGQLGAIERELDLRIEAENVERGKIYDKGSKTVQSMKTIDLVKPDANALMLEKASGENVSDYIQDVKKELQSLKAEFQNTKDKDGGYAVMHKIHKLKEEVLKRQGYVAELAKKWIVSGIYEEGFYHGDLHAGNIMVDDKGVTVLDFGNATQITPLEQECVLHIVCAVHGQSVDGFIDNYYKLLSPESKEIFETKKAEFRRMLNTLLFKKDANPGQCIAAILAESQKLGLEIPAAVYNFSQCQIRLQNTVEDMRGLVNTLNSELQNCCENESWAGTADPFAMIKEDLHKNVTTRLAESKKKFYERKSVEPIEAVVKKKLHASSFDKDRYLDSNRPISIGKIDDIEGRLHGLMSIYSYMAKNKIEAEELENFRVQMTTSVGKLFETLDEHMDTPQYQAARAKTADTIKNAQDTDAMLQAVDEFIAAEKGGVIDEFIRCDWATRKTTEIESKEETEEQKNRRIEVAKKVYDEEFPTVYDSTKKELLSNKDNDKAAFAEKMKGWFEDETNYGAELKEAYNNVLEAQKNGSVDGDSPLVTKFMEVLEKAMIQRAKTLEALDMKSQKDSPPEFLDVMKEVIHERIFRTSWSLGIKGLWKYTIKTNKKEVETPEQTKAREKKEAAEKDNPHVYETLSAIQRFQANIPAGSSGSDKIPAELSDYADQVSEAIYNLELSDEELTEYAPITKDRISKNDYLSLYELVKFAAGVCKEKLSLTTNNSIDADAFDSAVKDMKKALNIAEDV